MPGFGGRDVVAEHVAAVVGEPQLPRARVPVEAHAVADAAGEDLEAFQVGIHPGYRSIRIAAVAGVARRAHGHVEPAVGTEADEFPAVGAFAGKAVEHDLRLRRRGEVRLDRIEAGKAVHLGHVERAIANRHAVGHVEAARDRQHLAGAAAVVADGVDLARAHRAHEERALLAEGHGAGVGDIGGESLDVEAGRKLDALEREHGVCHQGYQQRAEQQAFCKLEQIMQPNCLHFRIRPWCGSAET
jgi:hypothetical protein